MIIGKARGMTIIVKTVTRLTLGFILLYAVYIALTGHSSPGGGFVGGAIMALAFVHIMLAFGKEVALKRLHSNVLRTVICLGALIFLVIVMVSFQGGCLITNPWLSGLRQCNIFNNEVIIPLCEMVIVGGGLFAIFIALVLLSKSDKDSE